MRDAYDYLVVPSLSTSSNLLFGGIRMPKFEVEIVENRSLI